MALGKLLVVLLTLCLTYIHCQSCPAIQPGTHGPCMQWCQTDGQCHSGEKCCSNGCGHMCMKVVNTTTTEAATTNTTTSGKCENGPELQGATCSLGPMGQQCPNGYSCKLITELSSLPHTICCPTRKQCPKVKCKFMKCQFGYAKDENGCRKCECNEPCKNIKCGLNKACQVQVVRSPSKNIANKFIGKCVSSKRPQQVQAQFIF